MENRCTSLNRAKTGARRNEAPYYPFKPYPFESYPLELDFAPEMAASFWGCVAPLGLHGRAQLPSARRPHRTRLQRICRACACATAQPARWGMEAGEPKRQRAPAQLVGDLSRPTTG